MADNKNFFTARAIELQKLVHSLPTFQYGRLIDSAYDFTRDLVAKYTGEHQGPKVMTSRRALFVEAPAALLVATYLFHSTKKSAAAQTVEQRDPPTIPPEDESVDSALKAAGPGNKELNQLPPSLEIEKWRLWDKDGNQIGLFFTSTQNAKPTDLSTYGFEVSGPFSQVYEPSLGNPTSRADGNIQLFDNGAIQIGTDGTSRIVKGETFKVSDRAKELQPPPNTPFEMLGKEIYGTTYTFGDGKLRLVLGQYTRPKIDPELIKLLVLAMQNPECKAQKTLNLVYADNVNLIPSDNFYEIWKDEKGVEHTVMRPDWSSAPEIQAIINNLDTETSFETREYSGRDQREITTALLEGYTYSGDAYSFLNFYDTTDLTIGAGLGGTIKLLQLGSTKPLPAGVPWTPKPWIADAARQIRTNPEAVQITSRPKPSVAVTPQN